MIKVIIFDFDGTVADTFEAIVRITNRLSGEFGYKRSEPEDLDRIRKLSSKEIVKQSGISVFRLPFLLKKLKEELNQEIHRLSPIPGIQQAIVALKEQGNRLGIITSNDQNNVLYFLKDNQLQDSFDFIYSGTALFGKSKVINTFLKQANLKPEEAIYVGDETRDIEAAKKSRIKMIAVSWGFNSKEVLAEHHPDFLIHDPQELIEVIGRLQKQVF